ncbi:MAG: HEPN domain-containing protein [Candidatus Heimdallarchaeota archaeon]|nr:HEPN domain-containing protein [Candidatus Heimdallarchaeota archaeon]
MDYSRQSLRIAHKALKRAKDWMRNAEVALEEKRWNDVVYSAQMGAEQSMKGILLAMGVSYKRVHDISVPFSLLPSKEELSEEFRQSISKFSEWLVQLTEQRHLAGYGFEEDLNEDHFKEYAPIALNKGQTIYETCVAELNRLST